MIALCGREGDAGWRLAIDAMHLSPLCGARSTCVGAADARKNPSPGALRAPTSPRDAGRGVLLGRRFA
jgi:hypothetical protein